MATDTLEELEDRLADLCGHRNTLDALPGLPRRRSGRNRQWADGELCEFAKLATVTQLRRVLRSYDFPPDPHHRR